MFRLKRLARRLSLLLSLVLILAPVLPSFAFVAQSGDAPAAHAFHNGQGEMSNHASHEQTSCAQHDFCNGQCCASCAQCSGAVFLGQTVEIPLHPIQTPVLNELHSFFLITSPDRPPRSISF